MSQNVSKRGKLARTAVRLSTSIPVIGKQLQDGTLRQKLRGKEPQWRCPKHLQLHTVMLTQCSMEMLAGKGQTLEKGVVLQLHGGGYYGAMRNKYRDFAGLYHEVSDGLCVLTPDYRVAPQHPYPAALQDAYKAYCWILQNGCSSDRLFLAGDSAGGGLALALVHYLKAHHKPLPAAIITMSAWTDLTKSGESYQENFACDPLFGRNADSLIYKEGYYRGNTPENPFISPLLGDFSEFPPMLMQVGEYEMLLSDTVQAAQKARQAGVKVNLHIYPGMFHVFQMGELLYKESKEAWVEIGRFIRKFRNLRK